MKFIREAGHNNKQNNDEIWGIKTELLHVFKRNNRVSSIYVDDGPSVDISLPLCKILDKNSISWLDLFAFEVCSRFENNYLDFFRLGWSEDNINTPHYYDINCDVYGSEAYDVDMRYGFDLGATDKDIFVLGRNRCKCDARCFNRLHVEHMFAMKKSSPHPEWVNVPQRHEYYQNWMLSKCCFISPKFLVAVGIARNKNFSNVASISTTVIELFDFTEFFTPSHDFSGDSTPPSTQWKVLKSNLPNDILNSAIVTADSNDMYLIGGFVYDHGTMIESGRIEDILQDIGKVSNRVFKGKFLKSEKDISWTEVESLIQGRGGHVAFKMGNNIYVAGGFVENYRNQDGQFKKSKIKEAIIQTSNWTSSCERYDLNEEKWSVCSYVFPPIDITLGSYGVSSDVLNATVSRDETLAIINCKHVLNSAGDWKGMTISFTEKDGFNVHEHNCFKSIKGVKTTASYIKSPHESDSCTTISLCLD